LFGGKRSSKKRTKRDGEDDGGGNDDEDAEHSDNDGVELVDKSSGSSSSGAAAATAAVKRTRIDAPSSPSGDASSKTCWQCTVVMPSSFLVCSVCDAKQQQQPLRGRHDNAGKPDSEQNNASLELASTDDERANVRKNGDNEAHADDDDSEHSGPIQQTEQQPTKTKTTKATSVVSPADTASDAAIARQLHAQFSRTRRSERYTAGELDALIGPADDVAARDGGGDDDDDEYDDDEHGQQPSRKRRGAKPTRNTKRNRADR
jgi:hypothetical protein